MFVFKITTNCVLPVEMHSVADVLANGNETRNAVSVASVMVVPRLGVASILTIVDESLALVTAEIVAPTSMRRAIASRLSEFCCISDDPAAGLVGELERDTFLDISIYLRI